MQARSRVVRYGLTIALVALATGLSVALGPVIEGNPFLLFHGTVALVGGASGWPPACLPWRWAGW